MGQDAAQGIGVMGVGVVGQASEQGTLEILEKCRGKKQLGAGILRQMRRLGYAGGRIRISHSGDEAGALELMRRIREVFGAVDVRVGRSGAPVSYTHLRAHETGRNLVCRLLLEKKKKKEVYSVRKTRLM